MDVLAAMHAEIPRLEVEAQQRLATAVAVGTGALGRDGTRDILRGWREIAGEDDAPRRPIAAATGGLKATAAAMGITVVEVPSGG